LVNKPLRESFYFKRSQELSMRKSLALLLIAMFSLTIVAIGNPVSGAYAIMDTWVSKAPMPTARTFLGAAEVNGKIYAIGGFSDLNNTEEYDPLTDNWTIKAAMPTPRFGFAIVVYQNKIYCIGGLAGGGAPFSSSVTGAIEVYDPATNAWEIKKPMPTPRAQLEANVVNDKIYLIGGRTGGQYSTVSTNQVYDPISEKWEAKRPMLYPVVSFSSAVVGDKIYVIGGQDEFNNPMNLDIVQIYDCTIDSWTIGTPLPTSVLNSAACTVPNSFATRIYLIGGQLGTLGTGGNRTNLVQVYNPANSTWSAGVSILTARDGLAVAVVNNTIYAMGGAGGNILSSGEGYAENEAYTPNYTQPNSPSPTLTSTNELSPIIATGAVSIAALVVGVAGLLIYFKKRKKGKNPAKIIC
jgi:N-acetylneuraminic acid mutarotase